MKIRMEMLNQKQENSTVIEDDLFQILKD